MRILQVNTRDLGGGAEGSVWNLFQSYRSRGQASWLAVGKKLTNDPDVFLIPNEQYRPAWTRFWWKDRDRLASRPRSYFVELASLLARLPQGKQWFESRLGRENFDWPGTRHLLGLPPQRPEIIHCHNLHGNYFDLRLLPWLSSQVPLILNLRDAWLLSGHCAHSFACERWKIGCGKCPDLTIYPSINRDATRYNWQRKREIFSKSRLYITTISDWLGRQVQDSMLKGAAYRVIPNGIDLTIFHPGNKQTARNILGIPERSTVVLYAAKGGRNNRWRDFGHLKAAMLQIANPKYTDLTLICIGELQSSEEIAGKGLRIIYQQFEQDPGRMALYYQAADVYAFPALAEAFGKTVAEAMACSLPVVASRIGGINEQIADGDNGYLVPAADAGAMAGAIQGLLDNETLHRRIGNAAAEHARSHFSLERQVDNFLNWYGDVRADWLEWSARG
jgi:glycosyltransferase involved in cell wall biosynthesis